jgi:hypothetical protein
MAYPIVGFWFAEIIERLHLARQSDLLWISYATYALALWAMYRFVGIVVRNRYAAALATGLYALAPAAMQFTTDAGGYLRSLGLAFSFLALFFAYRAFFHGQSNATRSAIVGGIFAGLAISTHPGEALFTVLSIAYFFIFGRPYRDCIKVIVLLGIVAALVSTIWWIPAVSHFGMSSIVAAAGSRHTRRWYWPLTLFRATSGSFVPVLGPLALVCAVYELSMGRLFLAGWLCVVGFAQGEPFTLRVGAVLSASFLAQVSGEEPASKSGAEAGSFPGSFVRSAPWAIGGVLLVIQFLEALAFVSPSLDKSHRSHNFTPEVISGFLWIRTIPPLKLVSRCWETWANHSHFMRRERTFFLSAAENG